MADVRKEGGNSVERIRFKDMENYNTIFSSIYQSMVWAFFVFLHGPLQNYLDATLSLITLDNLFSI